MKISILQSNYIPWKGYFDIIKSSDKFIIYDIAQFTKNDWRNRNKIKTTNGIQWLTIPVKGHISETIYQTKVANKNWANKHWKTIKLNYLKTKYFHYYEKSLEDIFQEASEKEYLSEINCIFIKFINNILDIKTEIIHSSDIEIDTNQNPSKKLLSICKLHNASHYISGPSAKDYLDIAIFKKNSIDTVWMDYSNYPEYNQLHGAFNKNVSVLDLILNQGPSAKDFLKTVL